MDDYYAGAEGARRVMNELDHLLQHLLDHVEPAETLRCAIQLRVRGTDQVEPDADHSSLIKRSQLIGADCRLNHGDAAEARVSPERIEEIMIVR